MLFNSTRKQQIIGKTRIADSFFLKLKGLMFFPKKQFDFALIFPMEKESRLESSIHMLFVFFPIDVLWLDNEKMVVDKREALAPFVLGAAPKKPACYIVELPAGKAKETMIGDKLKW